MRFETPPGQQAQVNFARFVVQFADEPGVTRIIWLLSMVLGCSRYIFARFVMQQYRIEQGKIDAIEALDHLLLEEVRLRKTRRVEAALLLAKHEPVQQWVRLREA